jgi:hypothetical protein
VRFIDVRHEGVNLKSSTFSQVVLNDNVILHAHYLKPLFGPNCFAGRKPNLMLNMYVRRGMVNKDATSLEGGRGWLAEGIICSSANYGLKVVHRDSCSRYQMPILEGAISLRDNCLLGGFLGASRLLRELTDMALWRITFDRVCGSSCNGWYMTKEVLKACEVEVTKSIIPFEE